MTTKTIKAITALLITMIPIFFGCGRIQSNPKNSRYSETINNDSPILNANDRQLKSETTDNSKSETTDNSKSETNDNSKSVKNEIADKSKMTNEVIIQPSLIEKDAKNQIANTSVIGTGGVTTGNGGDGLLCTRYQDKTNYIMTNDHYELISNFKDLVANYGNPALSVEERAFEILVRLKEMDPTSYEKIKSNLTEFFKNDNVKYWEDHEVTGKNDANMIAYPTNCQPIRIISQRERNVPTDKIFNINKKYWDLLDDENKISLALHESIYKHFIQEFSHETSERARYFNNMLISNMISRLKTEDYNSKRRQMNLPLALNEVKDLVLPKFVADVFRDNNPLQTGRLILGRGNDFERYYDFKFTNVAVSDWLNMPSFISFKEMRNIFYSRFADEASNKNNFDEFISGRLYFTYWDSTTPKNSIINNYTISGKYQNDSTPVSITRIMAYLPEGYLRNNNLKDRLINWYDSSRLSDAEVTIARDDLSNLNEVDIKKLFEHNDSRYQYKNIDIISSKAKVVFSQNQAAGIFSLSSTHSAYGYIKAKDYFGEGRHLKAIDLYFNDERKPQLFPDRDFNSWYLQSTSKLYAGEYLPLIQGRKVLKAEDTLNFNLVNMVHYSREAIDAIKPFTTSYDDGQLDRVYFKLKNGDLATNPSSDILKSPNSKDVIVVGNNIGTTNTISLEISENIFGDSKELSCRATYEEVGSEYELSQNLGDFIIELEKNSIDRANTSVLKIELQHLIYNKFGQVSLDCELSKNRTQIKRIIKEQTSKIVIE